MPALSVAVAYSRFDELSATATVNPGDANAAADPLAAAAPAHAASVYTLTVEPASAAPWTRGALSLAGEAGSVAVRLGANGAVESST